MHVIWKRPDGFHGASPTDFKVIEIAGQSRIWLHKSDKEWFPFQVSGGWQESENTKKLNGLVNTLPEDTTAWVTHLLDTFHDTLAESAEGFLKEQLQWLNDLKLHLKGDKWETEIMTTIISELEARTEQAREGFLAKATTHEGAKSHSASAT